MPADENVREVGSAHRLITPLRWPLGTAPPTFSDSPFIKLDFQEYFSQRRKSLMAILVPILCW